MTGITVRRSRTIRLGVDDAFARTIAMPLPRLFDTRHGPIPPIVEVRDQTGTWDRAGLTRTIVLGDGATLHEALTEVDAPNSFSYRITEPTGPMGLLIDHADGVWSFADSGAGSTAVTWQWTIHPRSKLLTPAVRLFGVVWKGMAAKALVQLEKELT